MLSTEGATRPDAVRQAQALMLVVFALATLPWLETFANGVDQSEYAMAVEGGYLPHSPYIVYLLVGRPLASLLGGALGLATLSFVAAVGFLTLLVGTATALLEDGEDESRRRAEWSATLGVAIVGCTFLFYKHAITQEVYMFQACLVLASLRLVARPPSELALVGAGVFAGLALGAHTGTTMVLPALGLAALWSPKTSRTRAAVLWGAALIGTTAAWVLVIDLLLPESRQLVPYLQGITKHDAAPGLESADAFIASASGLWERLTDPTIASHRGAHARGPVGLNTASLIAAAAGLAASLRTHRRLAVLGIVYAVPFAAYEIRVDHSYDWGLYVVYVLPPVAIGCAATFSGLLDVRGRGKTVARTLLVGLILASALGSAHLRYVQRDLFVQEQAAHYSDAAIAAMWMRDHLDPDAVVLQPSYEHNYYVMPLYLEREHCQLHRRSRSFRCFVQQGKPWIPLNSRSYRPLKDKRLRRLVREGTPVYAIEANPLGMVRKRIRPEHFRWVASEEIPLAEVAVARGLPAHVRDRVGERRIALLRAEWVE